MKKILLLALCCLCCTTLLQSCMGEEPLNMECDILDITIDDGGEGIFYNNADAHMSISAHTLTYTRDTLSFITRIDAQIQAYAVQLAVTEGATIFLHDAPYTPGATLDASRFEPFTNGTKVDFSQGIRVFRIVSEDKAWNRDYYVRIMPRKATGGDLFFDFNTYELDPANSQKFYIWPVTDENARNSLFQTSIYWCNGNPGFKLSKSSAKPDEYPSVPALGEGPDGSDCVLMTTRDTGSFGIMVGLRMAPGSMFNGSFDVANALKNALKATLFGAPFNHKPVRMSFDAKFVPGPNYQDKDGTKVEGLVDEPDAYICFFRNTDAQGNPVVIDGNDVLTNPNIIGMARLPHNYSEQINVHGNHDLPGNAPIHSLGAEWKHVVLDLQYTQDVDPTVLANMGYSMYIGFSSSWQGGFFEGALDSRYWIDNLRVECEE